MRAERPTCVIAGCGPAGAMLGYLLARQGLDVLVLEKHADFLRDFRGDTIHPSTLTLMDELGLGKEFAELPLQHTPEFTVTTDDGTFVMADFRRIPVPHKELVFLPQWDFLDFLTEKATGFPGFTLRREATVTGLITEPNRVVGLTYSDADGDHEVCADLVVATDGRGSVLRSAARLPSLNYGAPMDVLWFRLPHQAGDTFATGGRITQGRLLIRINRGDYWQTAYIVPKGGFQTVRDAGIEAFRAELVRLDPALADRVGTLTGFDHVSVLDVQVNRLRRWHRPGLLCLGDAAHAMSPVAGVGINLAIQDAVAAGRLLSGPLGRHELTEGDLAAVQRRRMFPTVVTQFAQRQIQDRVLRPMLAGRLAPGTPALLRLLDRHPALRTLPAVLVGLGVRPEHAR